MAHTSTAPSHQSPAPTPKPRSTICPYCGARSRDLHRCDSCRGLFDPLSRQATQNAMGPWFIRDEARPHRPGCSYETLVRMIARGQVTLETVLRGPSTLQFWTVARWCPGVAHLLGICHSCGQAVEPTDPACGRCGAAFRAPVDRQTLGLGEIRYVPGRPGDPIPASQVVSAAATPVPQPHATEGTTTELDPVLEARVGRMARQLAISRRWTVVWCIAFALLALALGTMLTIPVLDLDAGPVGRWLERRAQSAGEVGEPDLGDEPLGISPGEPEGAGQDEPVDEGGVETDEPAGNDLRDELPMDAPADSSIPDPEQIRGRSSGEGRATDDSMLIYERLARLR